MIKKILFSSLICYCSMFGNNELVLGETKDFAEKDMLISFQEHLVNNKDEIEKRANKAREQMKENAKNYKPKGLIPLAPALKDRIFYPDLTYTLNEDIKDQNGKIIYAKGLKFNPAQYVKISYAMVVIDGTNPTEVKWFKNSDFDSIAYKLLLSDGNYYELMQDLKKPIFYLVPQMREALKIEKTPSIIKQVGQKIQVQEICIPCLNENNITKGFQ
ncbi:putative cytoplasmic protein [Campylobacter insulaenigrae]|uniref:chromosome segregation protein ParM n=1 Tax=Campylobacter insulaenigrae TaxID=260714 RepID=UPI000F6F5BDB|nr:chromosome segregation protein ParM [Campylobacter insulaenigrae]MCR6574301.1 chromosome segregation protein ParM [Campylobacter insulaenigrae]MCR6591969.1 chromosome segregation protein ParM [Campylobacter insulaenigrae]MCR6592032.1 chromosome segregation protein ParM [Campylobacter insulaenigrae]VEJ53295.1 putative cytoplasmic protein [Campylobacter insulaenigrae]